MIIDTKFEIEKVFSTITKMFYTSTSYFSYIPIFLMITTGLVIVVVFGSELVIYFRSKNQCHGCAFLTKFCLIIFGLINFIFSGIMVVFVFLNFSIGGMCDYAHLGVYGGDGFAEVSGSVPVNLSNFMSQDCILETSEGKNITDYAKFDSGDTENFKLVFDFIDGISYYNNFLKSLDPDTNNNSITTTEALWDLYKTGIKYNFDNIDRKFI